MDAVSEAREQGVGSAFRQAWWIALVVAALAAAAAVLPGPVADSILKRDVRAQAEVWRDRVVAELSAGGDTFSRLAVTPEDAALLSAMVRTSDIFSLALIGPDDMVFWASGSRRDRRTPRARRP